MMSRDWNNCGNITFNLRSMTNKAHLAHRCSMLIIGTYSIAVVVYISVIMEINNTVSDKCNEEKHQLFLKMEFPFNYHVSPICEIIMFIQFIQLLSNASVIGMLDALIVTLVSCLLISVIV